MTFSCRVQCSEISHITYRNTQMKVCHLRAPPLGKHCSEVTSTRKMVTAQARGSGGNAHPGLLGGSREEVQPFPRALDASLLFVPSAVPFSSVPFHSHRYPSFQPESTSRRLHTICVCQTAGMAHRTPRAREHSVIKPPRSAVQQRTPRSHPASGPLGHCVLMTRGHQNTEDVTLYS